MRSFESREDYLEAILVLQNEKGAVRSIDIAAKLGFTKPSVSRAIGPFARCGIHHGGPGRLHPSDRDGPRGGGERV